ncbi:MAG: hypothetical protein C4308_02120 [Chitinophagaceae bacterium]
MDGKWRRRKKKEVKYMIQRPKRKCMPEKNARAASSSVTVKNKEGRIEKRTSYNPNKTSQKKS